MDIFTKNLIETTEPIETATGDWVRYRWDINLSSILTKLIQDTGRFVEHYASDILITLRNLDDWLQNKNFKHDVLLFGLREFGVDHEAYIRSTIENFGDPNTNQTLIKSHYRKIYAIEGKAKDGTLTIHLKNVPTSIVNLRLHKHVPYESVLKTDYANVNLIFDKTNDIYEPEASLYLSDDTILRVTHKQHNLFTAEEYFLIRMYHNSDSDRPGNYTLESHQEEADSMLKAITNILNILYNSKDIVTSPA